jgi:transcriptional regulator with XRE-family HTH domain
MNKSPKINRQSSASNTDLVAKQGIPSPRKVNLIGRAIARLRFERRWTQATLAARMQIKGYKITRDIIANIESRRSVATDEQLAGFLTVFKVQLKDFFPPQIQDLDRRAAQAIQRRPVQQADTTKR